MSPTLLGRKWTRTLELNISALQPVEPLHIIDVADLLRDYSSLFMPSLGTFEDTKVKSLCSGRRTTQVLQAKTIVVCFAGRRDARKSEDEA